MILYHVSTIVPDELLNDEQYKFEFRVPTRRGGNENNNYGRICASDSIKGALSAIPTINYSFHEEMSLSSGLIIVFEIDTDKYGIDPNDIYTPKQIYEAGFVDDAIHTGEHWISAVDGFTVGIEDIYVVDIADFILSEEVVKPYQVQGQVNKHSLDYVEIFEFIEHISFSGGSYEAQKDFTYYNSLLFPHDLDTVILFLEDNNIEWDWTNEYEMELYFKSNKIIDLKLMKHVIQTKKSQ